MSNLTSLHDRVERLMRGRRRTVLGVTGPPGSGKSTFARAMTRQLNTTADGHSRSIPVAAYLPMDGFHLADVQLDRLGLLGVKGAPASFDADGYVNLLERVGRTTDRTVYAPDFGRELEQPVAASIAIEPSVRLVVTEGNYLLVEEEPWNRIMPMLVECWYLEVPHEVCRCRLVARHRRFGKSGPDARNWVDRSDMSNAQLVVGTRYRADLIVSDLAMDPPDE